LTHAACRQGISAAARRAAGPDQLPIWSGTVGSQLQRGALEQMHIHQHKLEQHTCDAHHAAKGPQQQRWAQHYCLVVRQQ
jgi:hypothetical protein